MSAHPVRKLAHITAKPGQSAALRAALQALETATRQEPGCVEFTFYQALTTDASFLLLEHFTDQQALQTHMQLPHTQAFFQMGLTENVSAVDVPSLRHA